MTRIFLPLGCLFVALKLLVLALPPDEVSPIHLPAAIRGLPGFEEWRRGLAALEWLRGPVLPWLDHQQGHFNGGTLLTNALVAVSFAVLEPSPFAMRLPNLLFDLIGLGALVSILLRLGGPRAAWAGGAVAVIGTPTYWIAGAPAWGAHVEANGVILFLIALWLRRRASADRSRGGPGAVALGFVAGAATWFHYGVLLWVATLVLVELSWVAKRVDGGTLELDAPRTAEAPWSEWGQRGVGFALGLLPWFVYNVRYGWQGLAIDERAPAEHLQASLADVGTAFVALWRFYLPESVGFAHFLGPLGPALDALAVLAACVAWLALVHRVARRWRVGRARSPEAIFVLYPILLALAFSFSTFQGERRWVAHGARYVLPLHPVAWSAFGLLWAHVATRSTALRRGVLALTVALGATSLFALGRALEPRNLGPSFEAPGSNLESLGRWIFRRRLEDPDTLVVAAEALVRERAPVEADIVLFTLGNCLLYQANEPSPPADGDDPRAQHERMKRAATDALGALTAAVPPCYAPYFSALQPGERAWSWSERDRFWRQWDRRGAPRPPGAYAH